MEPLHGGRVSPGGAIGAEGTSDADDSRSSRVATETDFVRAAHASVDSASRLMYRAGAVFLGFSWDLSMQYAMWHAFHVGSCFFGRFVLVKRAAALLACLYHTIAVLLPLSVFQDAVLTRSVCTGCSATPFARTSTVRSAPTRIPYSARHRYPQLQFSSDTPSC